MNGYISRVTESNQIATLGMTEDELSIITTALENYIHDLGKAAKHAWDEDEQRVYTEERQSAGYLLKTLEVIEKQINIQEGEFQPNHIKNAV